MILGTKLSANPVSWHPVTSSVNNQEAVHYAAFTSVPAGFITRLGVRVRSIAGTPSMYLAIYEKLPNGEPGVLLGRTGLLGTTALGANVESAIAWVNADIQTAVYIPSGGNFLLGYIVQGGTVEIGVAGNDTAIIYSDTEPVGPPAQQFSVATSGPYPRLALYADFTENAAPTVALTAPANGAALNTTAPVFTGTFTDANSGLPVKDYLSAYAIEVSRDGQIIWGGDAATFPANAAERSTGIFNRGYIGPALTPGLTYTWRAAVADASGEFSEWSTPRTFQINAKGVVTLTSPTEGQKVETSPAALTWSGRWHQPQGHAMSNALVQILLPDGRLYKSSPVIAKSVTSSAAPGTAFTVSAAEAQIGAIPPGQYIYRILGYDAVNSAWSTVDEEFDFRINAPPTVPANLQPPDGSVVSTRPLLEFNSLDPDADDVEGIDVEWDIEITRPNGTIVTAEATTYDATLGIVSFQTTTTEIPSDGSPFLWRARARDVSAGAAGTSAWSKYQRFSFLAGPVVTVTAPTENQTVDTVTPLITFALSGGGTLARFRPYFYLQDQINPVWAHPKEIASALGEYRVPAGVLRNKTRYETVIEAWDQFNVKGVSQRREFYVDYAPAEPLVNPSASEYRYPTDPIPTSMLLTWTMSNYTVGEFEGYNVYRRLASEGPGKRRLLRTLKNIQQNKWVDPHSPSSRPLIYELTQMRRIGLTIVESEPIVITTQLDLKAGTIVSVQDPSKRIVLWWRREGDWPTRDTDLSREEAEKMTWGSNARPLIFRGVGDRRVKNLSAWLRDDDYGTRYQYQDMLTELWRGEVRGQPRGDSPIGVVSYRDNDERIFGILSNLQFSGAKNSIMATFQVRETDFLDGVLAG